MNLDYNTVFYQMTPQQIEEANIALDMHIEQLQKSMNQSMNSK